MRIDSDMHPLGMEVMMQRLQAFQAQLGPSFQMTGGPSGMSGNLPGANSFAPLNPKAPGLSISAEQAPADLKPLIDRAADENGIDRALLDAVVAAESNYNPNSRSSAGALGLTQLMPENVRALGIRNPTDPEENLQGGARYLSQMLTKFPGRMDLALAAYNAGPGAVAKFGGKIPPYSETQKYVKKVLDLYEIKRGQP